ncbi:cytochrome P450 [Bombardia bombarda]|uniref:Cytochrome P450 n=1 Tax=Bombardia bombarda TaxID=252184 RepID=A0AA39XAK2_9PEZI|nr:cytochrome P450 [Bombardia bombarda]
MIARCGTSLQLLLVTLTINYTFLVIWCIWIYPRFFHPLRNFPAQRYTLNDGIILLQGHGNSLLLTKLIPYAGVLVSHPYYFAKWDCVCSFLRPILGDGLVVVEGEQHKFLRKNTMPAFKFGRLKELYPMMWEKAVMLSETLKERVAAGESTIDMGVWASKVTLDIIGVAGLGRELNALKSPDDPLLKQFAELVKPNKAKFIYFFLTSLFPPSLVHKLPLKSKNFTESELVDQLLTFLAAGHETIFSVFTWATHLLATHPEAQAKLRAEVTAALPQYPNPSLSSSSAPSTDNISSILERLPYLNGVMHEALRLYLTIPITVRVATQDTTLAGHPVAKGTELILSPWLVNRYTEIWGADAAEFRPERWIDVGPVTGNEKPNNTGGVASNYGQMTFFAWAAELYWAGVCKD